MDTLREHLQAMLYAVDEQVKIPNTKLNGCCWLDYREEPFCTMCAAGAWYAQKYGRRDISDISELHGPILDTMSVMNFLRKFDILEAHLRLYERVMKLEPPNHLLKGDFRTMDDEWRSSMDKLLIWLTVNNL